LLLALVACALAATQVVDSFNSNTPIDASSLTYDPKSIPRSPQSSSTADVNVLGGTRSIYITSAGGFNNAVVTTQCKPLTGTSGSIAGNPTASAEVGQGLSLSNPIVACNGGVFARYDGTTGPLVPGCDYYDQTCVPSGKLNLNLASATSFSVTAGADLDKTFFAVFLYSSDNNWCGNFQKIDPQTSGTPRVYSLAISDFLTPKNPPTVNDASGSGDSGLRSDDFPQSCSLSNIVAIEVQLVGGTNWDQVLTLISFATPDLITLSGNAFDDCGCVGSTASPRNGVQVQLFSGSSCNSGNAVATTTTTSNGGYVFSNVAPGTYTVCATVLGASLCSSSSAGITRTFSTSTSGLNFFYAGTPSAPICPADRNILCTASTSSSSTGQPTFSAGCGGSSAFTESDVSTPSACSPGGVVNTIRRTFTTSSGSCTQTITISDDRVTPVLSNIPQSRTIGCSDPDVTDVPTVSGSTCNTVTVNTVVSGNTQGQCDINTCTRGTSYTRTFTPVDSCGNTGISATQTITRDCQTTCPTCPTCPTFNPVPVPTSAPKPVVGPLNCKFICDDADSSAVATMVSLLVVVVLAVFAL